MVYDRVIAVVKWKFQIRLLPFSERQNHHSYRNGSVAVSHIYLIFLLLQSPVYPHLESTFYAEWSTIEKVLPYTDIIISDIKHMDTNVHRKHTGRENHLILENLKKLADLNKEIILRIPVIPGVNDSNDNLEKTADFILNEMDGKVRTLQLLSFMRLGEEKYQSLGIPYKMENIVIDRKAFTEKVKKMAEYFNGRGIHCQVGTKEKQ